MQVGDPLLGKVLHCSFSAMSMRLLEVPASKSWLTLCWLQNFSSWGTSEGATFPKNVPTSSPHALLATGASRILILDSKCPDSHLYWFTLWSLGSSREGGVWAVVLNVEFQSALSWQSPVDWNALPLHAQPLRSNLSLSGGPGGAGWCGTSAVLGTVSTFKITKLAVCWSENHWLGILLVRNFLVWTCRGNWKGLSVWGLQESIFGDISSEWLFLQFWAHCWEEHGVQAIWHFLVHMKDPTWGFCAWTVFKNAGSHSKSLFTSKNDNILNAVFWVHFFQFSLQAAWHSHRVLN